MLTYALVLLDTVTMELCSDCGAAGLANDIVEAGIIAAILSIPLLALASRRKRLVLFRVNR